MTDLAKAFQKFAGKEIALHINQATSGFSKPKVFTPDLNDTVIQEIFRLAAKQNIYVNIVYPVPMSCLTPSNNARQVNMHLHLEKDKFKVVGFTSKA